MSIQSKERLTLIAFLDKAGQIRVCLAQLLDDILNLLQFDLGVPRDATVRDKELDKA